MMIQFLDDESDSRYRCWHIKIIPFMPFWHVSFLTPLHNTKSCANSGWHWTSRATFYYNLYIINSSYYTTYRCPDRTTIVNPLRQRCLVSAKSPLSIPFTWWSHQLQWQAYVRAALRGGADERCKRWTHPIHLACHRRSSQWSSNANTFRHRRSWSIRFPCHDTCCCELENHNHILGLPESHTQSTAEGWISIYSPARHLTWRLHHLVVCTTSIITVTLVAGPTTEGKYTQASVKPSSSRK